MYEVESLLSQYDRFPGLWLREWVAFNLEGYFDLWLTDASGVDRFRVRVRYNTITVFHKQFYKSSFDDPEFLSTMVRPGALTPVQWTCVRRAKIWQLSSGVFSVLLAKTSTTGEFMLSRPRWLILDGRPWGLEQIVANSFGRFQWLRSNGRPVTFHSRGLAIPGIQSGAVFWDFIHGLACLLALRDGPAQVGNLSISKLSNAGEPSATLTLFRPITRVTSAVKSLAFTFRSTHRITELVDEISVVLLNSDGSPRTFGLFELSINPHEPSKEPDWAGYYSINPAEAMLWEKRVNATIALAAERAILRADELKNYDS